MEFIKIEAWPRNTVGKTANAKLRRDGKIPAVAYGAGVPTRSLTLIPKDLATAIQGPYGRNAVLEVKVGQDQPFTALVCDYTFHPVERTLVHVDLLQISLDKPVEVDVPLVCIGKSIGVTEGGVLRQVYRTIPVTCLPANIPTHIDTDITELKQGDVTKASQLKMPEGVTVRLAPEQTIVAIVAPEAEKPEEGEAGAAAAEGAAAPAAGAEGAPAAGAPAAGAAAAPAKEEKKEKKK